MVDNIRLAESALGSGKIEISKVQKKTTIQEDLFMYLRTSLKEKKLPNIILKLLDQDMDYIQNFITIF